MHSDVGEHLAENQRTLYSRLYLGFPLPGEGVTRLCEFPSGLCDRFPPRISSALNEVIVLSDLHLGGHGQRVEGFCLKPPKASGPRASLA